MSERSIFLSALEIHDEEARQAYLDRACAGDVRLRQEVETLLRSHESVGTFLDVPVTEQIGVVPPALDALPASARSWTATLTAPEPVEVATSRLGFLEAADKPGSIGRLAHYDVLEVLGQGAFGIVLKAFDEKLHRLVAIKVLAPELAVTSAPRKRFLREARSAAAVRHENLVSIHAVEEEPVPYLVMEYVPGQTLQDRLDQQGPLDVPAILEIGRQIAAGLVAAHGQGLIHRDIKPANILLEKGVEERVKITDFGLARTADDASLTQSGLIAGTPLYMAPEQARGETIDQRADLFSLGSVLYLACTGRPPFRASNALAVLKRVTEDTPRPIQEIIPEVPAWLCQLINKLLEKDPNARFQSALEVARTLEQCQAHHRQPMLNALPAVVVPAQAGASETLPADNETPGETGLRWLRFVLLIVLLVVLDSGLIFWGEKLWGVPPRAMLGLFAGLTGAVALLAWSAEWLADRMKSLTWSTRWHSLAAASCLVAAANGMVLLGLKQLDRASPQNVAGLPASQQSDRENPDSQTAAAEWIALFNGRDLTGWQTHSSERGDWQVVDGTIAGAGRPSYLYTVRDDFTDFQLRLEAQVNFGGDGGVLIRTPFEPGRKEGLPGYEAQVQAGAPLQPGWETGALGTTDPVTGWKMLAPSGLSVAAESWVKLEITVRGNHIETWVDGQQVADYVDADRRVTRGRIALQQSGPATRIKFRNIQIRPLPTNAE